MTRLLLSMLVLTALAAAPVPDAAAQRLSDPVPDTGLRKIVSDLRLPSIAADPSPDVRTASRSDRRRFRTRQRAIRRKTKRLGAGTSRPLGGCASAVVTRTDELGRPIFPRSIAPVDAQAFVFTNDAAVTAAPFAGLFPPPQVRALFVLGDPPMFTITNGRLAGLSVHEGTGTVVGAGVLTTGQTALVRCPVVTGAACTLVHDFGAGIGVEDVKHLGGGDFLVHRRDGAGGTLVSVVTADDVEIPIVGSSDFLALYPLGFFVESIAAKDGVLFVGGTHRVDPGTAELRPVVVRVPLTGTAELEELPVDLGRIVRRADPLAPSPAECAANVPRRMTFLGGDLVLGTPPCLGGPGTAASAVSSRLLRVRLSQAGEVLDVAEIPVDLPDPYVNLQDLEALGGQLFVTDSQVRFGPTPIPDPDEPSARILRICT